MLLMNIIKYKCIVLSLVISTFISCNKDNGFLKSETFRSNKIYENVMNSKSYNLTRSEFLELLSQFSERNKNKVLKDLNLKEREITIRIINTIFFYSERRFQGDLWHEPETIDYFKCKFNKNYVDNLLLLHKEGRPSSGIVFPELNVELGRNCADNITITDIKRKQQPNY
jgi:hypothetical protein